MEHILNIYGHREDMHVIVRRWQRSGMDTFSTTPDPGYHMGNDKNIIKHHKEEPRGQPFRSKRPQGSNEQTQKHDK